MSRTMTIHTHRNLRTRDRLDDERRDPIGIADTDRCRICHGPILRTATTGLCWSCMPTS